MADPNMTWEQKALALQGLGQLVVRMRSACDWYAYCENVGIANGVLYSHTFGNGRTPTEAIETYWDVLTQLGHPGEKRRWKWVQCDNRAGAKAYRWNGFMWQLVSEAEMEAAS